MRSFLRSALAATRAKRRRPSGSALVARAIASIDKNDRSVSDLTYFAACSCNYIIEGSPDAGSGEMGLSTQLRPNLRTVATSRFNQKKLPYVRAPHGLPKVNAPARIRGRRWRALLMAITFDRYARQGDRNRRHCRRGAVAPRAVAGKFDNSPRGRAGAVMRRSLTPLKEPDPIGAAAARARRDGGQEEGGLNG